MPSPASRFPFQGSVVVSPLRRVGAKNRCTPDFRTEVYRARYFNPPTGRFWTIDSLKGHNRDPLSLHKYVYCKGNPANWMDPSGYEVSDHDQERLDQFCAPNKVIPQIDLGTGVYFRTAGSMFAKTDAVRDWFDAGAGRPRYAYSLKYAWVDLNHVACAASVATDYGDMMTSILGYGVEVSQWLKGDESGFDPEDPFSNSLGMVYTDTGHLGINDFVSKDDATKAIDKQPAHPPGWKPFIESRTIG
jgi:RHS repeat-associated protein